MNQERRKPKKIKKKSFKDLNSMYTEYLDEVDAAIQNAWIEKTLTIECIN